MRARTAPPLLSFIGGLGGRRFRSQEFDAVMTALHAAEGSGGSSEPTLLYSEAEYTQVMEMLRVAHGGRSQE